MMYVIVFRALTDGLTHRLKMNYPGAVLRGIIPIIE